MVSGIPLVLPLAVFFWWGCPPCRGRRATGMRLAL